MAEGEDTSKRGGAASAPVTTATTGVTPSPADQSAAEEMFELVAHKLCVPRVPLATYRVQFNKMFTFEDATRLADYLAQLGVSELYASPFFKARPGSMHGYDLVDHNTLNPEVGTREHFDALSLALSERGLGLLLDFVPNHMGIGSDNAWWMDVLENGPSSLYAEAFDIDWAPLKSELRNKVLLPILGNHYGQVLDAGELRIDYEQGAFFLRYYETTLPVNPRMYPMILEPMLPGLMAIFGEEHDVVLELQSIITGLTHLPPRNETHRAKVIERRREKEILKRRLATAVESTPEVQSALTVSLARMNGKPGDLKSFDALSALLEEQAYRLSFWRVAAEEINYRRFFDVNDLAAIRMENPAVFTQAHRLMVELIGEGRVTGIRIDHPDGLWEPEGYFSSLQRAVFLERARRHLAQSAQGAQSGQPAQSAQPSQPTTLPSPAQGAPSGQPSQATPSGQPGAVSAAAAAQFERFEPSLRKLWDRALAADPRGPTARPVYIAVEKILARGETLPEDWSIHGTSGYEYATSVSGLFVDGSSERAMTELYERFTGIRTPFDTLVYEKKKIVLLKSMASELNVLAHALNRISERDRHFRDFTLGSLTDALREVIACFPIYRTYVSRDAHTLSEHDRIAVSRAVRLAQRRNPTTEASVFGFLRSILMLEVPETVPAEDRVLWREFVMKFQQLTGPVMAKGLEDTAFYNYNRLVSLNEVGGEPEQYGTRVNAFHRSNTERQRVWPGSMLATSTHDTKRSEDVRARISVLSEVVPEWEAAAMTMCEASARFKTDLEGQLAPDRNEEYLVYQTIVGTWPWHAPPPVGPLAEGSPYAKYIDRIVEYMRKATKEAKVNTSWINANPEYDAAVEAFVRGVLTPGGPAATILAPLAQVAGFHGMWGSLSQTLLKLTSPGVPDIYQGTEMWDDSLVDPDNRRPVDYASRIAALDEIRARQGEGAAFARELMASAEDGRIKLFIIHAALRARERLPENFGARGTYVPLDALGQYAEHVVAFARRDGGREVVVIAPRLSARLAGGQKTPPTGAIWGDTRLAIAEGPFTNLFTGETLRAEERGEGSSLLLAEALADLPVALLERAAPKAP